VIAAGDVRAPEARELRACALAALAEAGVLALPVWLVFTETRGLDIGATALAVPFVAAYVAGALLACRFRASRNVAVVAVVLAVASGVWLGHGDINRTVFAMLVCLLVAFRLVALALRDWRVPIHAEFGWFAVGLGLEVMIAADATIAWRGPLVVIVPLFFVAALASRASTVWTTGGAGELDEGVRAAWVRRAVLATGALVAAMVGAVVLSVRDGVFDRIGAWLTPTANELAEFLAWILSQAARPIFWLVDRLGIDPDRVREFLESLRRGAAARASGRGGAGDAALWQRLLGLLVFAAIAYAVFRAIRRFRPPVGAEPEPRAPAGTESAAALPEPIPPRPLLRRELPADRVRRWYAQTLEALRRRHVVKDPWLTPAEFVPLVVEAVPSCAEEFAELTRAYQDVRYGSLRMDRAALRRLEAGQERIDLAIGAR
jgi:hypothetical protein